MTRVGTVILTAFVCALLPAVSEAQFVLRDDTPGWGWLKLAPTNRAVVQLVYGSPENGDQGTLELRVLEQLRSAGIRRLWAASDFDPTQNEIVAECAATRYTAPGSDEQVYGLHTEVSFWDHTRLAATEIYEAITLDVIAPTHLASDTYVDRCVGQLAPVLVRLGFDEG